MLLLFFLIFLLVQFVVSDSPTPRKQSFLGRYGKLLLIYAVVVIPVVLFTYLIPQKPSTPDELIDVGKAQGNTTLVITNYEQKMNHRPYDVALHLEFVDYYLRELGSECSHLMTSLSYQSRRTELITTSYIQLHCENGLSSERLDALRNMDSTRPYRNLILGYHSLYHGQEDDAIAYWEAERSANPTYSKTYNLLARHYMHNDPARYTQLLADSDFRSHVAPELRQAFSFKTNNWWQYTISIIDARIKAANWVAVLCAFLITLVWVAYCWKMDIYNPEKWWNIALVFVLSMCTTFLCLPLYDYAHYGLGFYLNGSGINDFFYSFLVIGASEELVKFLPWILFGLLSRKLKEAYDYLLYASIAALGFAFVENWMYLENYYNITTRSLMTIVSHIFDASVIAYAFILARFRYADKPWRHILPPLGFVLAALSHGFYDFWLISPAVKGLYILTILFFVFSLHLWFFFKNNALNHSSFHHPSKLLNTVSIKDLMIFSILGILMLEYCLVGNKFGTDAANGMLFRRSNIVGAFLFYFNYQVGQLRVEKGIWSRFRFKLPPLLSSFFRLPRTEETMEFMDLSGKTFTFYTSKTNRYIGSQLPISGTLLRKVSIQGDQNWYLVELVRHLTNANCVQDKVLVRAKSSSQSLKTDKVEVLFLLIPSMELLEKPNLHSREFWYTGAVFARPKD